MLVNKIEVAKDTVHQFTNQVITVSDTITHSSRDYITRDEVINLFDVAQTLFNNQTTIMLTVFAIGIAILGIMIPLWQKKNLKDTERRLDKDSKSNENRVNRELDQYRLDINEFKTNIDDRIDESLYNKFKVYDNQVEETIKELEVFVRNQFKLSNYYSSAKNYIDSGNYSEALPAFLYLFHYSFRTNSFNLLDEAVLEFEDYVKYFRSISIEELIQLRGVYYDDLLRFIDSIIKRDKKIEFEADILRKALIEIFGIVKE